MTTVLLWHCSAILTLIGIKGQIQCLFRLVTNENIILCLKLFDSPIQFLTQSLVKSPIVAHCHLCLQMSEGKHLISILKIWV